MAFDRFRPDRYELEEAANCFIGVAAIMDAPRSTSPRHGRAAAAPPYAPGLVSSAVAWSNCMTVPDSFVVTAKPSPASHLVMPATPSAA